MVVGSSLSERCERRTNAFRCGERDVYPGGSSYRIRPRGILVSNVEGSLHLGPQGPELTELVRIHVFFEVP